MKSFKQYLTETKWEKMAEPLRKQITDYLDKENFEKGKTVKDTESQLKKLGDFKSGKFTYLQATAIANHLHESREDIWGEKIKELTKEQKDLIASIKKVINIDLTPNLEMNQITDRYITFWTDNMDKNDIVNVERYINKYQKDKKYIEPNGHKRLAIIDKSVKESKLQEGKIGYLIPPDVVYDALMRMKKLSAYDVEKIQKALGDKVDMNELTEYVYQVFDVSKSDVTKLKMYIKSQL